MGSETQSAVCFVSEHSGFIELMSQRSCALSDLLAFLLCCFGKLNNTRFFPDLRVDLLVIHPGSLSETRLRKMASRALTRACDHLKLCLIPAGSRQPTDIRVASPIFHLLHLVD